MTTAMVFFLLKKNLDFYATMCHILIDGMALTYTRSTKCNDRRTQASFTATSVIPIRFNAAMKRWYGFFTNFDYGKCLMAQT